jgi:hypothetical protein
MIDNEILMDDNAVSLEDTEDSNQDDLKCIKFNTFCYGSL